MMRRYHYLLLYVILAFAAANGKAKAEIYVAAYAGGMIGPYSVPDDAVVANYRISSRSRNSFSPSFTMGYWFSKSLALELAYTGDGVYHYGEYFLGAISNIAGAENYLLVKTVKSDIALGIPVNLSLGHGFSLELVPAALMERIRTEQARYYWVSSPPLMTIRATNAWAASVGVRLKYEVTTRFSVLAGYRVSYSSEGSMGSLSLGARVRF